METSGAMLLGNSNTEPNGTTSDEPEVKSEFLKSPTRKAVCFRNGKKYANKKFILPPPPRASPTSSSGFPGVSWNKRMGAWLAFYYDQGTRRSRTFHPKYFEMDVEKAKLAAIDFMKNIEKHPKCSLRKNRRERHDWSNSHYVKTSPEFDDETEFNGRRKRRAASKDFGADGVKRSPLSCSTEASIGDMYFDPMRPKFLNGLAREKSVEASLARMARVKHENDMMEMTPTMFNQSVMWGNCNMYVNSQDFCRSQDYGHSSQESNFMPSFDGFTSPNRNFSQESMIIGNVENDHDLSRLMHSIHNIDPLDPGMNFMSGYNCSSNSMSSPYLSPYNMYRAKDDSSLSRASGFQGIMMQPDPQQGAILYSPNSPYIMPIDSN